MSNLQILQHNEIMKLITVSENSNINKILDIYGVCIIPNVLDEHECNDIFNEMIWSLERRTNNLEKPFRFEDISSWSTLKLFNPLHNMLYRHWGLGQDQYVHDLVRSHPNVINVFKEVWGTDELICSFDGINLHLPGELSGEDHFMNKHWYHFDQSFLDTTRSCFQGVINMFDTNEGDAGLHIFLKSHKKFEQYVNKEIEKFIIETGKKTGPDITKEFKDHFRRIKDTSFFTDNGCKEIQITCPKGSLVIWDSRMLHDGSQPNKNRFKPNIRAAFYICMLPIQRISEYAFSKKIFIKRSLEAVQNGRTTGHWPQYRKLESYQPSSRAEGKTPDPGFIKPKPAILNTVALKLATGEY